MDNLEKVIEKFIDSLPAHQRLYPDIYSERLAEVIRNHLDEIRLGP